MRIKTGLCIVFAGIAAAALSVSPALSAGTAGEMPCDGAIAKLEQTYRQDATFKFLVDQAFKNMQQVSEEYRKGGNPWIGKSLPDLAAFLRQWCTFLPQAIGSGDTGLENIEKMDLFSYQNPFGQVVVQTSPGKEIFQQFIHERGTFLDSSASTRYIADWLADPRIEKQDYTLPDPQAKDGGFTSFNDFFSRTLKDQRGSRPQTMPERDYIIAAPTDCIMNTIPMTIADEITPIPTKGGQSLNITEMLDGSEYAKDFVGGTALSCVLMPNTYHRYHSPVAGRVIASSLVDGPLLGMQDFPSWVPSGGNVGYYGTDFDAFSNYKRGYFIVDTGKYGKVAMVAVGLSTVGSVVFNEKYYPLSGPVPIERGDELGHFLYGGSLFLMFFEPGRYASGAVQVRLGNQIGTFDTKTNE